MNESNDTINRQKRYLSTLELSEYIGKSKWWIYSKIKRRQIPFIPVGRDRRFDLKVIDEWLASLAIRNISYKRGASRYWWYSFKLPGRGQVCASTKTTDRKLAEAMYYKARTEFLERKTFKKPLGISVKALLEWMNQNHWHRDDYKVKLKALIDHFNNKPAAEVTVQDILDYRQLRLRTVEKSTVNRDLAFLKAAYNAAIKTDNMLAENPVEKVKFFDVSDRKVERYLEKKEKDLLFQATAGSLLQEIIFVAIKTGMRQGEILDMKWEDVDLENNQIKVICRKGNKIKIRHVPMFEDVIKLISSKPRLGDYVFCYKDGSRLSRWGVVNASFRRIAEKLKVKLGIKHFRFHDLRHTFASDFLMRGGSLRALSEILGHSTTTMTARYGHLSKEHLMVSINLLPKEIYCNLTTVDKTASQKALEKRPKDFVYQQVSAFRALSSGG